MYLSFNFCDENKDFRMLQKLLTFLNAREYQWIIGDSDVYNYSNLENLFKSDKYIGKEYKVYSGNELMNIINENIFYVLIEMYAFNSATDIPEFSDNYIKSNCEIAIIVDDCNYYTIYLNHEDLELSLLSFLKANGIDIITQSINQDHIP